MEIFNTAQRRALERDLLKTLIEDESSRKLLPSSDVFEAQAHKQLFDELRRLNFDYVECPAELAGTLADVLGGEILNGQLSVAVERLKVHRFDDESISLSELGLARRFAAQHAGGVRYDHTSGKFLLYRNGYWQTDTTAEVFRLMETTVAGLYGEAESQKDGERRKQTAAFALKSESITVMQHAVEFVKKQEAVAITSKALDRDNLLVSVENGTLDLRQMNFRAHDHRDLITRQMPVKYNEAATYAGSWWEDFLREIYGDDQALIAFIQRSCGYALSGLTDEQYLWFLHGNGANGKSTFIRILAELLASIIRPHLQASSCSKRGMKFLTTLRASGERALSLLKKSNQADGLRKVLSSS